MIDPLWLLLVGMIVVLGGILLLRLHAFLALTLGALIVASLTTSAALERFAAEKEMTAKETAALVQSSVGERVAQGFGRTCTKIGILIAMASIIGKFLLESGAAERIVRSLVRWLGERRASHAFLSSGFLLGMPVFFDTVFYLMMPLGKAMGIRARRKYGLYVMSIVAGATMTHSLVPPTPGPLFVAGELSVNIGLMIVGGIVVGLFTVSAGYLYALWANRRWSVPIRDTADTSVADLQSMAQKNESTLPPFWLSMLPIILPVLLIAARTLFNSWAQAQLPATTTPWWQGLAAVIDNLGNPECGPYDFCRRCHADFCVVAPGPQRQDLTISSERPVERRINNSDHIGRRRFWRRPAANRYRLPHSGAGDFLSDSRTSSGVPCHRRRPNSPGLGNSRHDNCGRHSRWSGRRRTARIQSALPGAGHRMRVKTHCLDERQRLLGNMQDVRHDRR